MRREFELEEWGCASEIKQNLNKIKAAPCKPPEKINFVKGTSYKLAPAEAKFEMKKRCVETVRNIRKETEKFGIGKVGFLALLYYVIYQPLIYPFYTNRPRFV